MKFSLPNLTIETEEHKRKILLGTNLIVIYFLVDLFFFIVNLFNPEGIPWVLITGAVVSLLCLLILRFGFIEIALFIFLVRANAITFYFAAQETIETGAFLYFISYAITPLAFFGYKDRWKGIGYAIVTFGLFLVAEFKPDQFSPDTAHFYFIANFAIVLFTAGFIFLFFDRINKNAEKVIIEKNKQLEKANEELDRFVYHASHDLRAPLSSILGLANIYPISNTPEEQQKIIDMISDRTKKLDEFIKEILAYSQNFRMEIKNEKVFLRSLVDECTDSLKFNPHFEEIRFDIQIDDRQFVITDASRLKVVFTNLISNSIKYHDKLKAQSLIKISCQATAKEIEIEVQDNGIGIKKEYQGKVFDMFYRAHTNSEGSGLGLYIAKECVKKISGQIKIESVEGAGTTIKITLPKSI